MMLLLCYGCFFFSSRRRHTRWNCDWSSDVCSSDLGAVVGRRDLVGVPVLELLEELLEHLDDRALVVDDQDPLGHARSITRGRSEEHTSELQSQFHLVCRLLLEKKNNFVCCTLDEGFLRW